MKRQEIINEVEKALNIRNAWSKNYDNGTMLTQYAIYYNKRARKPLGWLQVGYYINSDEVIGADIVFNNAERTEVEIENIEDIKKIIPNLFGKSK
jgi:hypothetical protein